MTDEEAAFLDAIRANPDDDTARLVYADWLDEQHREAKCSTCGGRGVRAIPNVWGGGTVEVDCEPCGKTGTETDRRPAQWAACIRRGVAIPERIVFAEGEPAHFPLGGAGGAKFLLADGSPGVSWTTYKGTLLSATCDWEVWREFGDAIAERYRLSEVELTTTPSVDFDGIQYLAFHRVERIGTFGVAGRAVAVPESDLAIVPTRPGVSMDLSKLDRQAERILGRRWPSVTFHLPPAEVVGDLASYIQQLRNDIMAGLGIPPNLTGEPDPH